MKAGNAAILRGGSDSLRSRSRRSPPACARGWTAPACRTTPIQLVPTADRAAVGLMLEGLDGAIDVIVPRGGRSLVGRVQAEARVPVLAHLEGICHVYVDASADLAMAQAIAVNAKMRRTGVCGAAETVLVDRQGGASLVPAARRGADRCRLRGAWRCRGASRRPPRGRPRMTTTWHTEYPRCDHCGQAGRRRRRGDPPHRGSTDRSTPTRSSPRTPARPSGSSREVDSAIVLHNASTQFADGGEFGFGAEIGIATGKLHARGPVGLEQLTTFKYQVRGAGQLRP